MSGHAAGLDTPTRDNGPRAAGCEGLQTCSHRAKWVKTCGLPYLCLLTLFLYLGGAQGEFNWEFPGCPHVGGGIAVTQRDGVEQLHALVWTGHEERHGLYRVRSTDGGDSWSEPRRVGGELARHADLGASGHALVAAWDEDQGISMSASDDQGESWTEPHRLSTDGPVASHPIVIHTGEDFVVFWTERGASGRRDWKSYRLGAHQLTTDEG